MPADPITKERAVAIAKEVALAENWPWQEPVHVRSTRVGFWGPRHWEVWTNAEMRGTNVRVVIDQATGTVLERWFLPR